MTYPSGPNQPQQPMGGQYPPPPAQYPPQYPPAQYPPAGQYPPGQYYQAPPAGQGVATQQPAAETNTFGRNSLIAGVVALVVSLVTVFVFQYVFFYFGLLSLYGVYAAIRGFIVAARHPSHPGLVMSIIGLVVNILALAFLAWALIPA